jgi:exo-beta-1,3-glucanase (GH17 family)
MTGKQTGCSCCRLLVVFTILLVLGGAGGFGVYYAVKNQAGASAGNMDNNDEAASEATGKMVGDNAGIKNETIKRVNRFYGMSYSPYGLGDNRLCPPFDSVGYQCLLSNQVLADVRLISTFTNRIKTYSLQCEVAVDEMLSYCAENRLEVMLGVWFSKSAKENKGEFARLDRVLKKHAKSGVIKDVLLGNEAVFIVGVKVADLAAGVKAVKGMLAKHGSKAKVGTAEIFNVWNGQATEDVAGDKISLVDGLDMTSVVAEVDWIGLNTHPYYGGVDPATGDAGKYVTDERAAVARFWKDAGKPVYITETGYPTAGAGRKTARGTAKTGVHALELFTEQIEAESRSNDMPVYFFEPFNADWKRRWMPYTEADYSWGMLRVCQPPRRRRPVAAAVLTGASPCARAVPPRPVHVRPESEEAHVPASRRYLGPV